MSSEEPLAAIEYNANNDNQAPTESSGVLKLDELGPIIIGEDGSMQRISNWNSLSDMEKKNALRLIAKRNKDRLQRLQEAEQQQQQQNEE